MSSQIALTSSRIGQHGKDSPGDVMLSESTPTGHQRVGAVSEWPAETVVMVMGGYPTTRC